MKRDFYSDSISNFLITADNEIFGQLSSNSEFADEPTQKEAWKQQIIILKDILGGYDGTIFFEYAIPRMGRRIDAVIIIQNAIFVLEFKVGEKEYLLNSIDQVWDYALDLKNFHETSHEHLIAPILVATKAKDLIEIISVTPHNDKLLFPIKSNTNTLKEIIEGVLKFTDGERIDSKVWEKGKYSPTPTIIEAAISLYRNHSVMDIAKKDATAKNLRETSQAIAEIIQESKVKRQKAICFVTGVPGAGKTLVGLNIATMNLDREEKSTNVFLSGNGPLVTILREALTRDRVMQEKIKGNKLKKVEAMSQVKAFIQNVHHFRDDCLKDMDAAPFEHVAIFDEAQRAWNLEQQAKFMKQKRNIPNFSISESEFLISCLDRHKDWAVVVCLVGGGQEINTGEAGISEWIASVNRSFSEWQVYISPELRDSEYSTNNSLTALSNHKYLNQKKELHLSVSMRSFRAEHLSLLMKKILDIEINDAKETYKLIKHKYPIVLTRDLSKAKNWLKQQARGTERYGIVVSSQAQRLKPLAIDVKSPMNPIHWFLDGKDDIRSSYFLEDVATEFDVQGLELDWSCVTWDGDFRYSKDGWKTFEFRGNKWQNIKKEERKQYLKNAYRVLLTRARQGMVIVVPEGDIEDTTRKSEYYNSTFQYLKEIGFTEI